MDERREMEAALGAGVVGDLERRGLLKPRWRTTDANRRAKYYELTASGRRQLAAATEDWRKLTAVVGGVLDMG